MVKLASARESRTYGPIPNRNRWECINAGVYIFAAVLLIGGLTAQLSPDAKSGLVLLLIGLALIAAVNIHDLLAHLAGIEYCLAIVEFDPQLVLVDLAVPSIQILGSLVVIIAVVFLLIQKEKGFTEKHAINLLMAGPAFWVVGSIHNLCEVYEMADARVQILQKTVQIPLLMGSLLFLVGGVFNQIHQIVGESWVWLCICGSLLFLVGGLLNVVKVLKMQKIERMRLEKLRDGAEERLAESLSPLLTDDSSKYRRRRKQEEEAQALPVTLPLAMDKVVVVPPMMTYKDVLVGGHR